MIGSLRFMTAAAMKDFRRLCRDPFGLAMCLIMPFSITFLVNIIFGGDAPAPKGTLLIVDHDDTFLSGGVRQAFSQGPLAKMIVVETVNAEDGTRRINRGDGSGLLVIPKNFQNDILHNRPCELQLATNPAQRILPGIIKEALTLLTEAEFYAQLMFGEQIRKFADRPPTEAEVAEFSLMGKRLGEKLAKYLDPPIITLETTKAEVGTKPRQSLGAMFFPGMLLFGLMMVSQTLGGDIWKEKVGGTLRRTLTTAGQTWAFLAGKTLSTAFVMFTVALLGLICARILVHQPAPSPIIALGWVTGVGTVFFLLFIVVNMSAGGETGANVLTSIVVFLFAIIGGGMFPFEMMPDWLAKVGGWSPNGWATIEFKHILAGETGNHTVWAALALAGFGAVMFIVAAVGLKRFALR